jgi:hypothetical protein
VINSSGTITNLLIQDSGAVDTTQTAAARTITDCSVFGNGTLKSRPEDHGHERRELQRRRRARARGTSRTGRWSRTPRRRKPPVADSASQFIRVGVDPKQLAELESLLDGIKNGVATATVSAINAR